jgi:hypothetical protein
MLAGCGSHGAALPSAPSPMATEATMNAAAPAASYQVIYRADFAAGIDRSLLLQGPRPDSFALVDAPGGHGGKALRISINRSDNFSGVANGVPRAEVSVAGTRIAQGREYFIEWTEYLPSDYAFDSAQPEGLAQIHSGPSAGTPPLSLTLEAGGKYQVDVRDGNGSLVDSRAAGAADRGRWVKWAMHYRGDASGSTSISEVVKDGVVVASSNGRRNAYAGDNAAYFKAGIYKWWWQERPSDVQTRTIYLADITISAKN